MGRKSISQRLKSTKKTEIKREIVGGWSKEWSEEFHHDIRQLEQALSHDDYDKLCIAVARVKENGEKRVKALPTVLNLLLEADNDGKIDRG